MQKRILFLFMVVWCMAPLTAQDSLHLSLEEAQNYALEKNRALKNASLDVRISEASRWQTIATMLPQVSAAVDYSNLFDYSIDFGPVGKISMPNSLTTNLTAAVAFSGAQVVGVQLKDIVTKMSNIQLRQTEKEVTDQIKTLYYSALVMEETTSLLEKNQGNLEKLLEFTEQSVHVGVSEQTDADLISVQVASMKTTINSTKRSIEMIYNAMRLHLGLDVNSEIELTQNIDELMDTGKSLSLVETDFVLGNNYNFQLLEENLNLAHKQITLKKWDYAPSLSAFYQYNKIKNYGGGGFNSTPPNMMGFSIKVPIFSSGMRYRAVTEAKLSYEQNQNNYDESRESLIIQHRQLTYNLSSASESFETQKKNMVVIQRVFDNVSRKYEQGMASSLDVTNSGTELISAQSTYVQSLLDVVNAQIELEMLLNIDNK
ncbi:MAG TPA: TolC family protein [Clostridiales bacterium]|nr:TolC family protein [Clostridiales bacterium]